MHMYPNAHLWLLEQEAFFGGDIEAAKFWSFLTSRYIVARNTGEMFVGCASSFLTVQLAYRESLYCQERNKAAEHSRQLNTVHFRSPLQPPQCSCTTIGRSLVPARVCAKLNNCC